MPAIMLTPSIRVTDAITRSASMVLMVRAVIEQITKPTVSKIITVRAAIMEVMQLVNNMVITVKASITLAMEPPMIMDIQLTIITMVASLRLITGMMMITTPAVVDTVLALVIMIAIATLVAHQPATRREARATIRI